MKNYTILLLALFVGTHVMAQEESKKDTVKVKLGDYKIIMVEKDKSDDKSEAPAPKTEAKANGYFSGIDIGFSFLGNNNNVFETDGATKKYSVAPARSLAIDYNFLEICQELGTKHVTFVTGASFGIKSYTFSNDNVLMDNGDSLTFVNTGIEYEKNKLRNLDLSIPLMLGFNTSKNPDKNLHLAIGVKGSFIWRSIYKTKYLLDDEKYIAKTRGKDFSVNPLRADAVARIGFRNYTLYATYPLTPLFDEDVTGQAVNPLTIGVQIFPF